MASLRHTPQPLPVWPGRGLISGARTSFLLIGWCHTCYLAHGAYSARQGSGQTAALELETGTSKVPMWRDREEG